MAVNNSLAVKPQNTKTPFTAYLNNDAVKNQINAVVGGKNGSRFISSIVSAVTTNEALKECSNNSIVSAALLGESLKLSPSPQLGHYYLVPFNMKKKTADGRHYEEKVAQFQLGYKGYIQLAIRSGQYTKLNVLPIKEGELVSYDPLNEEIVVNLIENTDAREKAKTAGYYAMFEYTNGFRKALYWTKEMMLSHADKYAPAFSKDATTGKNPRVSFADYEAGNFDPKDEWKYSSFWYKDFDGMACKTMLRQLISKWGIMSIEMQTAFESDMAVINDNGSRTYVENDLDVEVVAEQDANDPTHAETEETASDTANNPENLDENEGKSEKGTTQQAEETKPPESDAEAIADALFK